ncbi:hypothetical protein D3C72_1628570 [compost metagenome]
MIVIRAGAGLLGQVLAQTAELGLAGARDHIADNVRFDQAARREQVLRFLYRGTGDIGAAVRMQLHQSFLGQDRQGLPYLRAADAESQREPFLCQLHARRNTVLHDGLADAFRDGRRFRFSGHALLGCRRHLVDRWRWVPAPFGRALPSAPLIARGRASYSAITLDHTARPRIARADSWHAWKGPAGPGFR